MNKLRIIQQNIVEWIPVNTVKDIDQNHKNIVFLVVEHLLFKKN